MSKFDFDYMSNNDTECVAFNKKKWTKERALGQAIGELDITEGLIVFSSYVQYGYFSTEDNGVLNGWFIKDMYEPVLASYTPKKNEVAVWVVKKEGVTK